MKLLIKTWFNSQNSWQLLWWLAMIALLSQPRLELPYIHYRTETSKQRGEVADWPISLSNWVCTWMSSSSSLYFRVLYRNMPRLLCASPGQTTVTTASLSEQWKSAAHHCNSRCVLNSCFGTDVKVYIDAVIAQIRPGLNAKWSVRVCSLQIPSTVNM